MALGEDNVNQDNEEDSISLNSTLFGISACMQFRVCICQARTVIEIMEKKRKGGAEKLREKKKRCQMCQMDRHVLGSSRTFISSRGR